MVSAVIHRSRVMTYECEQMFTYHDGYICIGEYGLMLP